VLSVFTFHLWPDFLPGGFLGVDVFFVISGYLITGIIVRESLLGTFSFSRFYARRVKRIFPALFVVLALSSLIAIVLLTPETYVNYMKSARYAAAQLSNLFFMQNVDYFEEGFSGQPLLHTWSLGVEEQFYLLWPLLIYLCFRYLPPLFNARPPILPEGHQSYPAVGRSELGGRAVGLVLVLLFLGSYALCYVTAETSANFAFYMFFTRAFEFCIGGWLALGPVRQSLGTIDRGLAGLAGLALILGSFLVVRQEFIAGLFLRYGTITTCVGTALIIGSSAGRGIVNRLLATRLPVSIGKISYSLYLYHWPIIIFWKQLNDADRPGLGASLAIIALSFLLAALSYRYVEQPARRSSRPDRLILLVALAVIVVYAVTFRLLENQETASWRITAYGDAGTGDYVPDCQRRFEHGAMVFDCFSERRDDRPAIALVGDSHTSHYFCSVLEWAEQHGYAFKYIGVPGCPMLLGDARIKSWFSDENTAQCRSGVEALETGVLDDPHVEIVLIAQRLDLLYDGKGYLNTTRLIMFEDAHGDVIEDHTGYYRRQLEYTIDTFKNAGKEVALLGQVPLFRNVEACNWRPLLKELLDRERICSYDDAFITAWQQPSRSFFRDFATRGQVPYFDPFPHLSQPLVDGVNLYKNVDHLNDRGCLQLAPPVFEFLDQLIVERQQSGG
jgi:peptidoglycan/LPS O-acetylase OafA/YrhL